VPKASELSDLIMQVSCNFFSVSLFAGTTLFLTGFEHPGISAMPEDVD